MGMRQNRREFYRVKLYREDMLVRFVNVFGNREQFKATIHDISGNGVCFRTIDQGMFDTCEMEFNIQGQSFQRSGQFLRREHEKNGVYKYVVTFDKVSEKELSRLTSLLMRIDVLRRRK